jgi:hypothetical protein
MAKNKKEERKIYRDFTLDEFDEFTFDRLDDGANEERGKLIAELERRSQQLMFFSETAELVPDRDIFAQRAYGLQMAIKIIQNTRKCVDNVGCPECEGF